MAVVARGFTGLTSAIMPSFATDSTKRTPAKEIPRCWQSFVISDNTKVTPTIKDEVRRHGFPPGLRADAYYFLSGASALQLRQPENTYNVLALSTSNLSDEAIFSVEDDVRNARVVFKDTRLFSTAKGAEVLSRIVFGFMQRNPACGYFKGLAHMAALLLTVFGREREEQAFWTLVALMERRLFPTCSGQAPSGSRVEVHVLQTLLEQRHPALAALLAKLGADALEHLCYSWFCTAFTRTLPHEVVLRIWDCAVVEGPKVCLRVAIALIKMFSSSIQSCSTIDVLCRVIEGRLSRCTDADALLSLAFKGIGSLSSASVDAARLRVMAAALNPQQQQQPLQPSSRPLHVALGLGFATAAVGPVGYDYGSSARTISGGLSSKGSSGSLNNGAGGGGSRGMASKQASPSPSPSPKNPSPLMGVA